jgi:hypothetical protein
MDRGARAAKTAHRHASMVRFMAIIASALLAYSVWGAAGGSISGKVTDPGGRTVPNATVTATNTETNFKHTSTQPLTQLDRYA